MNEQELIQYLSDLVLEFATKIMRKIGLRNITSGIALFLKLIVRIKSAFMVEILTALAILHNIQGLKLHTK